MQKGNLLLFVASLGIVWVHASTTSPGYCCPQITVELDTEDDGTYTFLAEGNGPAMEECQNACVYAKDSNKTDLYCFKAVTSADLGNGQVQCEAISPYSLLMSTTPAVTGPTAEELLKKIEDLQKDFEAQVNQTETLKKDLADQTKKTGDLEVELKKEVEAREAEVGKIKTEVNSIDGRLNKTEVREAVCGYKESVYVSTLTNLTIDRVIDEVDSSSGGELQTDGSFKAGAAGVYFVDLEASVGLNDGEYLLGFLRLSSGSYAGNQEEIFIYSNNHVVNSGGSSSSSSGIVEQASASRYVSMSAGETLHIALEPYGGQVRVWYITMCVSLYSASG